MSLKHPLTLILTTLLFSHSLALSQASGEPQGSSLPAVYARVRDSVVLIHTEQKEYTPWSQGRPVSTAGLGSGVLVSADGKVLTAAHVVQTADEISVQFREGDAVRAKVLASAPVADIALIQLEEIPSGTTVAKIGDSDGSQIGDQVFVVGAPFGISYTLTVGHISARRSTNDVQDLLGQTELFQTDAAINQGNSGGPMFNMMGEVIGIVSHIITQSGGFEGLGFAVTSNTARTLLIERQGFWSGMDGYLISGDMARIFNVPQAAGILVQRVAENSPASRAGLRAGIYHAQIEGEELLLGGDIILSAMGIAMGEEKSYDRIYQLMSGLRSGEVVQVVVLREGQQKTLNVSVR